jgi:regulator of protease activity HflC (stomatin/prohibitin superfamily)
VILTGWLWPLFASSPEWYEKSPLVAVIYHQLGSLLVLLNSTRLLAFERTATNATMSNLKETLRGVDGWMDRYLNLDNLLHGVAHRWKAIVGGTLGVGVVTYALSGLTQIEPNEVGIVKRFGKVVGVLEPGLSWRWPYPVERVTRLRPHEIRFIEVGYRNLSSAGTRSEEPLVRRQGSDGATWASTHTEGTQRFTDEAEMITGESDFLVEVLTTVSYSISDPKMFILNTRDPDTIIRLQTEGVMRELVAGEKFLELLTQRRATLQEAALKKLRERLSPDLGIQIDGLALVDLHPPVDTVRSFHDVARAEQFREKQIQDAEATAIYTVRRSEANALRIVNQAKSESLDKISQAMVNRDFFLAWHRARTELPLKARSTLIFESALLTLFGGKEMAANAYTEYQRRYREEMDIHRFLIDTRLILAVVAQSLKGRPKILIDADKVKIRRHILRVDPDLLRLPVPAFPPDRLPNRSTRPDNPDEGP